MVLKFSFIISFKYFQQSFGPNNGNRTVQEYVGLDMFLTTNAGRSDGSTLAWREISPACGAYTYTPDPCDPQPRFIAPFEADTSAVNNHWVAGGRYVWETHKGWNTHCSAAACDWKQGHDTGENSQITALAVNGDTIYAGYCGYGCNPSDVFYSGIDTNYGGTWHTVAGPGLKNGGARLPAARHLQPRGRSFRRRSCLRRIQRLLASLDPGWRGGSRLRVDRRRRALDEHHREPAGRARRRPRHLGQQAGAWRLDVGIFVTSASDPGTWKRFGSGLPNAVTNDLTTTPSGGQIIAVTHGRGMWQIGAP